MKIIRKVIISLASLSLCIILFACETKTTFNISYDITTTSRELSDEKFRELRDLLLNKMEPSDVVKYECTNGGDMLLFTVTQEGNTDVFTEALDGDEESIETWNSNKAIYDNASSELYKTVKDAGLNVTFRFCVLNDENTEKALLVYDDNVCVYDPVNGIDAE